MAQVPSSTAKTPGCCDTISSAKENARSKRDKRKQQPWLVKKFAVFLVFGILIFTAYVVVGRVCVPLIQRGINGRGIGLMIGFWILFLWEMVSYIAVISIGPGFARDVEGVEKTNPPVAGQEYRPNVNTTRAVDIPPTPPRTPSPAPALNLEAQPGNTTTTDALVPPASRLQQIQIIGPPQFPVLDPMHRYCSRDGFVKPYRAHHCSMCGTCVLKFDHHCPWIGQCVGARNHKFFINFNFTTVLFTSYVFGVILSYLLLEEFDIPMVVNLALAGLFWIFTLSLLVAHIRLIILGQSTLENVVIHSLKERITHTGSFFASSRNLKRFSEDWGRPDTEGNIWYISKKENWEDVMGTNPWGWIFPLGRAKGDGSTYQVNGRFGEGGVWRKREDWPEEFRRNQ